MISEFSSTLFTENTVSSIEFPHRWVFFTLKRLGFMRRRLWRLVDGPLRLAQLAPSGVHQQFSSCTTHCTRQSCRTKILPLSEPNQIFGYDEEESCVEGLERVCPRNARRLRFKTGLSNVNTWESHKNEPALANVHKFSWKSTVGSELRFTSF